MSVLAKAVGRWSARQRRVKVRVGSRCFVILSPLKEGDCFNGTVHPVPGLRGTVPGFAGGRGSVDAYLGFCIIKGKYGKFQGITVPEEYQRQGWAGDMVRALLAHYPAVRFRNSSLNEMSGPLFLGLRRELPERIAPIRIIDREFRVEG